MAKATTFKCEVVKLKDHRHLSFSSSLLRGGYWAERLNELLSEPDNLLKLAEGDQSSLTQIRTVAKKRGVPLLFSKATGFVFIRAWVPSEDQSRMILLLRELRTVDEIRAAKVELNVEQELVTMSSRGHVVKRGNKWQLTDKGTEDLLKRASA